MNCCGAGWLTAAATTTATATTAIAIANAIVWVFAVCLAGRMACWPAGLLACWMAVNKGEDKDIGNGNGNNGIM